MLLKLSDVKRHLKKFSLTIFPLGAAIFFVVIAIGEGASMYADLYGAPRVHYWLGGSLWYLLIANMLATLIVASVQYNIYRISALSDMTKTYKSFLLAGMIAGFFALFLFFCLELLIQGRMRPSMLGEIFTQMLVFVPVWGIGCGVLYLLYKIAAILPVQNLGRGQVGLLALLIAVLVAHAYLSTSPCCLFDQINPANPTSCEICRSRGN